jgi:hypothetical protein
MEVSGGVAMAMAADTGTATPAAHIITMAGGDNIETSASGNTVTMAVTPAMAGTTSHDFSNGGRIGTDVNASDTLYIQAYNVGMASYATFATLTAGNTPTMDLDDSVTKGGNYIYRAGGTDVSVEDGGTGASTLTDHGVLVGSGTSAITPLAVGTNGQVLLGSDSADPVFASLTSSGSTIAFTPGAGTLNLETGSAVCTSVTTDSGSAVPSSGVLSIVGGGDVTTSGSGSTVTVTCSGGTGGGLTWSEVTGTTQALAAGNGYIANNASLVTFTLPATATVGQVLAVKGLGAGGWKIAQNASQYIEWDSSTVTTTGATGYLQSDDTKDYVELICTVTNNGWGVLSSHGNITVA